jgi:hypothetical protein
MENLSPDPITPYEELLLTYEESVSYYCTPLHQFYGMVKHDEFTMIFGPIGSTEYTQQEKRELKKKNLALYFFTQKVYNLGK